MTNRASRRWWPTYLEGDGHQVEPVFDGLAAVAAARRRRPDVVVLDLGVLFGR
jgi:DNA-binding response OmpR family regulator